MAQVNKASFKNNTNLKVILNEKNLLVKERGKLRPISVPSDSKEIIILLDLGYTNRIECCEKLTELFKEKTVRLYRETKEAYEVSQADFG